MLQYNAIRSMIKILTATINYRRLHSGVILGSTGLAHLGPQVMSHSWAKGQDSLESCHWVTQGLMLLAIPRLKLPANR